NSSAKLVTQLLDTMEVDLRLYGERPDTATALSNLARGYAEMSLGADARQMLQKAYNEDNPDPAAREAMETSGGKAGAYDSPHKRFHPGFRVLLEARGYADVLLLDQDGIVVYSVSKFADFGAAAGPGSELEGSGL